MKIKVNIDIEKHEGKPNLKAINTPLSPDKTFILLQLVPEDDVFMTKVAKDTKPAYFMMVILEMLDTLDEHDREFMFEKCESIRRDYNFIKGGLNES